MYKSLKPRVYFLGEDRCPHEPDPEVARELLWSFSSMSFLAVSNPDTLFKKKLYPFMIISVPYTRYGIFKSFF